MELTKSAKGSISMIYKMYMDRQKSGVSKGVAARFESKERPNGISQDIPELKSAGLISTDVLGGIELKPQGIIYMENQTADTIKEWLSFFSKFIP